MIRLFGRQTCYYVTCSYGHYVETHLLLHLLADYAAPQLPDSALHISPQNPLLLPVPTINRVMLAFVTSSTQTMDHSVCSQHTDIPCIDWKA